VSTLLNSIPAMGSIILLLFLVSCESFKKIYEFARTLREVHLVSDA
jgi:hypothetical protein